MPVEQSQDVLLAPGAGPGAISLPPHWQQPAPTGGMPPLLALSAAAHTYPTDDAAAGEDNDLHLSPPSPTTLHGLAPDRAAALFRAYDLMGRGWLSRTQMIAALSELSVVHGLGEKGLNQVLGQDPATSREARYSLQDFLAMYERIGLYQAKSARGERIRAMSAISQPPPGAANSLALRTVFGAYCRYAAGTSRMLMAQAEQEAPGEQRMNAQQLMRLCQDLELLSAGGLDAAPAPLTFSTVDVVFAKCKPQAGGRRLNYTNWLRALAALSDAAGRDLFSIITAHALRIQPQLADQQAAADDAGGIAAAGGPRVRSVPPSRERGGVTVSHASGLPRLRMSADQHGGVRASAGAGALQVLSPGSGRTAAPLPASAPGRLVVLERALMEEEARAAGHLAAQQADVAPPGPCDPVPAPRPAPSARPSSQPAGKSVRNNKQVPEAWPQEQPMLHRRISAPNADAPAADPSSGAGGEQPAAAANGIESLPPVRAPTSPAASRNSSPPRPRSTGSPLRATRLARVSLVDTAGVATEVWKYTPARPEAWDEMPPWMQPMLLRMQHLEAREEERCLADEALRQDIIFRTQKWEQAERLVVTKNATLETRLLGLERRTGDSDAVLGGLKRQVEALQEMGDDIAALRQQVAAAAGWQEGLASLKERLETELMRLSEALGESSGGWQAAVAMAKQAAAAQLEARAGQLAGEVEAVMVRTEGLDAAALAGQVEAQVAAMAEHLASELGLAAAQQSAAALAPVQAALAGLEQQHLPQLAVQVEEVAAALVAQGEAAAQLKAELDEAKAHISEQAGSAGADSAAALEALQKQLQSVDTKLEQHMDHVGEQLAELSTAHLNQPPPAAPAPATPPAPDVGPIVAALEAKLGAHASEVSTQLAELAVRQETTEKEVAKLVAAAAAAPVAEVPVAAAAPAGGDASALVGELDAKLTAQMLGLDGKLTTLAATVELLGAGPSSASAAADPQLAERLAELEESMGGFASAMAGISETARTDTQQLKALVTALEAQVVELAVAAPPPKDAGGEVDLSGVEGRCQSAEEHLAELSGKVQALEQSVAAVAAAGASAGAAVAAPRPASAKAGGSEEVDALRGELQGVAAQVGDMHGQLAELQGAVGRADVAAATAGSHAAAAQAAAAEAIRIASEATAAAPAAPAAPAAAAAAPAAGAAGGSSAELDARLAALSAELTKRMEAGSAAAMARAEQAVIMGTQGSMQLKQLDAAMHALEASVKAAGTSPADVAKLALLEGATVQAATKLKELEAGVQALAAKANAAPAGPTSQDMAKLALLEGAATQTAAKLQELEAGMQALAAKANSTPSGTSPADVAKLALLEGATTQTATKLQELEAGMQALASAALDTARRAQSAVEPAAAAPGAAAAGDLMALSNRVATLESSVKAGTMKRADSLADEALGGVRASGAAEGPDAHGGAGGGGGGMHASRRDHDALRVKVNQMSTQVQDLQNKINNLQSGGGGGGGGGDKPGTPPMGAAASQTIGALQVAQMQTVQQLTMMQGNVTHLTNKLNTLEAKAGSGGAAHEVAAQATASQLSLLQGAIVQLNGELNSLKVAVPQLMSTIKGSSGLSDASSLTAAVATGQYGPVLGAMAEEIQRCAVRAGNLESDIRISLTTMAKASDMSQLELMMGARTERLEETVEDLRNNVRNVVESGFGGGGGGGGAVPFTRTGTMASRMTSAVGPGGPGTAAPGGGDTTPNGQHRYATWDALKHAEGMLIKTQQQAKDELQRVMNSMTDLNAKLNGNEEKLIQRLDVKEKVLMRMAKEVDDIKTTVAGLASNAGAGGGGGQPNGPTAGPSRAAAVASRVKSHRYNMFDD